MKEANIFDLAIFLFKISLYLVIESKKSRGESQIGRNCFSTCWATFCFSAACCFSFAASKVIQAGQITASFEQSQWSYMANEIID